VADSSYLRFPHLAHNLLTFAAQDDVWLAPLDEAADGGARAWRLTSDRVPVTHPRLNPAGTRLAWSSTRSGASEAHAVAVDGGAISRLTYWGRPSSGTDGVRGWLSDTEVLVTSAGEHFSFRRTWAYAVPLDGPARRLPHGPTVDLSVSPQGAVLLNPIINQEPARWKRYRGGRGGQVWYSPDGTEFERILREVGDNLVNPMWVSGRVVFLSDHEGVGALYSALPDGSEVRRHTDVGEYYVRNPTTDGTRVVYQRAGELWLLASLDAGAEPVRLDVRLGAARSGRAPFPVSAAAGLGDYALSGTGRVLAAEVRGTAHRLPVEDGPARALLAEPGVRARIPLLLQGSDDVVCVSDSDGEDGIDIIPADGGETRRILSGEIGRVLELAASPDAKTLAAAVDDGRLLTIDVESGTATEIARSTSEEVVDLSFSPDSALLAWAEGWMPESGAYHVRLARLADREIVDITPPRFDDRSPVFTHDGKYLAFLSNRTFDTAYDAHVFDLGFLPGTRPYLVTLAAETPSPFAPELNGRPAEPADKDSKQDKDKGDDGDEAAPVVLDLDGIGSRVVPFPVAAGRYRSLRAVDGGVAWLDVPAAGLLGESLAPDGERPEPELLRYDLGKRRLCTLVHGLSSFAVSADGKRLAYREDRDLKVRPLEAEGEDETIAVDLDRIRVTVDPGAEWRQMYDENWRLMRDNYWRADMNGVDWAAMGERYRPLVERIGSVDEMHDLLWEVGAELGTSHAYVRPPAQPEDPARAQGFLGADLARDADGTWRVARILPAETSVADGRSPLEAPGVAARAGDAILAVDGRPVDPVRGPNAVLVGKAGKPVELTLRRDGGERRRVVVVPLALDQRLRYFDLVGARREQVHELSGGRLGYVHVPDMTAPGWADYHRDLHAEFAREGIVVDLRANRGGHTSQLVIEKLTRRLSGWGLTRRRAPVRYPRDAPRGPIVAVADEYAGSDGDIAANAFKRYGLGPVVGTRTWGGVVGIDSRYRLVDGTVTTQPKSACWFDNVGLGIENHGVDPDVEVPITPQDWAAGRDPQLETAVRLALEALELTPATVPPPLPPPGPETSSTSDRAND
jgi:tricorn protease